MPVYWAGPAASEAGTATRVRWASPRANALRAIAVPAMLCPAFSASACDSVTTVPATLAEGTFCLTGDLA